MLKIVFLSLALTAFVTSTAFPDTPGRPVDEFKGAADSTRSVAALVSLYRAGEWDNLQTATLQVLEDLELDGERTIDAREAYFCVVLIDRKLDGKAELIRYLVHDPAPPAFEMRLPGLDSRTPFFEVLLTSFKDRVFESRYSFKRKADPLLAKLPKLVDKVDEAFLGAFRFGPEPTVYATFHQMEIPFYRGTINVENLVTFPMEGKDGKKKEVSVGSTYALDNVPLRRVTLGLLTGLILSTDGATRAKVSNGVLSPDPITGITNMALLNWHPWGFDENAFAPDWRETLRIFFGAVFNPEFGVSAGLGLGVIRGLSINGGLGVLVVDERKDGEEFGMAPMDKENPFKKAYPTFWFVGFGYEF